MTPSLASISDDIVTVGLYLDRSNLGTRGSTSAAEAGEPGD